MNVRRCFAALTVAFGALVAWMTPGVARADILSSCGNIDVSASAMCELDTSGGCTARCTPVNVDVSCAAQFEAMCSGQCNVTADVNCNTTCTGTCTANCTANPGSFDCQGSCEADCEGHCSGSCSSSGNQSQCEGTCKADCGGHCNAQCTGTPPSADCTAKCQASCNGSCTAQANLNCDVMCQSSLYASCETMVTGGCQAQCSQPKGALFCDGHYVDVGGNLDQCVNDLKNLLHIEVQGSASCTGNACQAQGSASAHCAFSPSDSPSNGLPLAMGGLAFVGVGVARRRKARRRQ
jgi:hypothetical protein